MSQILPGTNILPEHCLTWRTEAFVLAPQNAKSVLVLWYSATDCCSDLLDLQEPRGGRPISWVTYRSRSELSVIWSCSNLSLAKSWACICCIRCLQGLFAIFQLAMSQATALQELLPNLTPNFLPSTPERDLLRLAEIEGPAGSQALLEVYCNILQSLTLYFLKCMNLPSFLSTHLQNLCLTYKRFAPDFMTNLNGMATSAYISNSASWRARNNFESQRMNLEVSLLQFFNKGFAWDALLSFGRKKLIYRLFWLLKTRVF